MRAALYARVSTTDQEPENQLAELRRYAHARGWDTIEHVDPGVSGAKERRPALDALMAAARRRQIDVVVCWRLDRFGRNLRHLITAIDELHTLGVGFVSLGESIDTTTPTGRLLLGILGSFAEFERERLRERIHAGLARAKRQGVTLGRRRQRINERELRKVEGLSVRAAAKALGVPASRIHAERRRVFGNPSCQTVENPE